MYVCMYVHYTDEEEEGKGKGKGMCILTRTLQFDEKDPQGE